MVMPTQNPTPKTVKLRPRYLQAIPSLVVLTTAMAWGALPDWDVGDDLHKKAGVAIITLLLLRAVNVLTLTATTGIKYFCIKKILINL